MPVIQLLRATYTESSSEHICHLVFGIGGTHSAGIESYVGQPNTALYSFDNPIEQQGRAKLFRELGVEDYSLGEGQTLRTLFEKSDHPAANVAFDVADMNATDGLGGAPAAAFRAAEILVESQDFVAFLQRLRDLPVTQTNGHPCKVVVTLLVSLSGGTGAGAVEVIAKCVEDAIASLSVPISVEIHAIGAITFIGLSTTAPQNAACVLTELVDFVTTGSDHLNVCRSLHLVEYSAYGDNASVRARLIALDHQAIGSRSMVAQLTRVAPNKAASNFLGNIDSREIHFFQSEPSIKAIQVSCAEEALKALAPFLVPYNADLGMIKANHWIEHTVPQLRMEIGELMQKLDLEGKSFIELAKKPKSKTSFTLLWDTREFGRFDLAEADHHFATPITSESELHSRLKLLATFTTTLAEEISAIEADVSESMSIIESFVQLADRFLETCRTGWWRSQRAKAADQLREIAEAAREMADQQYIDQAKLNTLKLAKILVDQESAALTKQLDDISRCLNEIIAAEGPQTASGLIVQHGIGGMLPTLMELPSLSDERRRSKLYRLACLVTRSGLAQIVGVNSTRIESIAEAIVFGDPTHSTPPLGAFYRSDRPVTIYVLPTMEAEDARLLRAAIVRRDSRAVVLFTDSINVGAAVLRYRFRGFPTVESLYPGVLKHDLKNALMSETGLLRFPCGHDCLERLGIYFDATTQRLTFQNLHRHRYA